MFYNKNLILIFEENNVDKKIEKVIEKMIKRVYNEYNSSRY